MVLLGGLLVTRTRRRSALDVTVLDVTFMGGMGGILAAWAAIRRFIGSGRGGA
jgi:hypothetical protein